MSNINININNTPLHVKEGSLLIDVLLDNDIEIAHFCYHKALGADGNCRMCMVEIEGQKRPQIACDTFVKEGMNVSTTSDAISEVRRSILELELINHPVDCPICDQAGECKLQDYYMDFGLYESKMESVKNHKAKHVDLGKNVMLDQERCVLCARCTRFTQNVTKTSELAIIGRGDAARVSTMPNTPLHNEYAMNVIDLCPVGALTSKDFRFKQRVWFLDSIESICHGCSRGCNIIIDHNQPKYAKDKIYRFRPRHNELVNGYFMCDEGRLSYKEENLLPEPVTSDIEMSKLLIKSSKHIVALINASLSCEQMQTIQAFCTKHSIELFSLHVEDTNFKDSYLKTSDRSANSAGAKALGINMDISTCKDALSQAELIINVNHPLFSDEESEFSKLFTCKSIHFSTNLSQSQKLTNLYHSFASFSHDEGTIINIDGIKQSYKKSIHNTTNAPTLISLFEKLGESYE